MRRFILIDHSIKGFGGHHYEYAVHVLGAAKDAGFEPVLAVNRAFGGEGAESAPWKIVPAYEHGFWRYVPPSSSPKIVPWRKQYFDWKMKKKYGRLGTFFAMLPQFRYHYTPATIAAEAKSKAQLFFMLLGLVFIKWPYSVLASLVYLIRVIIDPVQDYFIRIAQSLWHLILMIFFPVRLLKHLWIFKWSPGGPDRENVFGRDTAALFSKIGFAQDDLVFIPTLSEEDMLSLQGFLTSEPRSHEASWHLLFRRNLFEGPGRRNINLLRKNHPAVRAFRHFHSNTNGNTIRFYTDTARLTEEYNCLGLSEFHTLPIPINPEFRDRALESRTPRPLRVVYAGDARVEKGYHHLPDVVRNLQSNGHAGDVVFRIQSNFAQARPEDATTERLTRAELELFSNDRVQLIMTPLDSAKYFDLVASADILLVMYDAANYYSRSSGILVEALAGGIPVVAPAASWMGQQLAEGTYTYLLSAPKRGRVVSRHRLDDADFPGRQEDGTPAPPTMWFTKGRGSATLVMPKPWDATHVLVTFDRPTDPHTQVLVEAAQRRGGQADFRESRLLPWVESNIRCAAMFRLHVASDGVSLSFRNDLSDDTVRLKGLEIAFLQETGADLITDAVGCVYLPWENIGDQLRRMVNEYEHYRTTAVDFARIWNERHSAQRLVKELVS